MGTIGIISVVPVYLCLSKKAECRRIPQSSILVKIIRNGVESEWFELTKQQHRALLLDKPKEAIVYIEDFYPESPDVGTLVRLGFEGFTVNHMELSRQIAALTEDMEELRREKAMLLHSFEKSDDIGMKEIRQWVDSMKASLQKLEQAEERYTSEMIHLWRNTAICRI